LGATRMFIDIFAPASVHPFEAMRYAAASASSS
jgi:hypothetical protein